MEKTFGGGPVSAGDVEEFGNLFRALDEAPLVAIVANTPHSELQEAAVTIATRVNRGLEALGRGNSAWNWNATALAEMQEMAAQMKSPQYLVGWLSEGQQANSPIRDTLERMAQLGDAQ